MRTHCFLFEREEYKCISRFLSTEYAASFAIKRSCGTQSKTFDKSIKTPPTTLLLSKCCLHSSKSLINTHFVNSVQTRSYFWSVFSCIRTEFGALLVKFPYSVRIQENTDQKYLRIWRHFRQWHGENYILSYMLKHMEKCNYS